MVLALLSNPINSIPNSKDEASEAEMPLDEEEIETIDESLILFRQSGLNES